MELRYDTEFIRSFIVYTCPNCGHEHKFTMDEALIRVLEMLVKEC